LIWIKKWLIRDVKIMNYRRKANIVLGSVFVIFLMAAWLKHLWPTHQGIHFFFFVSEASLVGGIADWFAVTALFRKPLGWPYHTALIPRNRDKMIEGITGMVQNELLSETLIRKKIESFHVTPWLIRRVDQTGGAHFLARKLSKMLVNTLGKVSVPHAATEIERFIKGKLADAGISKPALKGVRSLLEKREFESWLDERIEEGLELVAQPSVKTKLLKSLGLIQQEQVGNGGMLQRTILGLFQATDGLNLDEAADSLQVELLLHLRELKQANHPLRGRLKEIFTDKLLAYEEDAEILNRIELWKNTLILETNLEAIITPILNQVLSPLQEGELPSGELLSDFLEPIIEKWWFEFKEDAQLQMGIDKLAQDLLIQALQTEHAVIGQVVRETLEGLNDEELNQFIEDKAGEDLQWIRINGSLVGGMVGAILFVLLNYGYAPLLGFLR
jgi:uncharacterized membrane-anchored protein YjiN (DUF445 family)